LVEYQIDKHSVCLPYSLLVTNWGHTAPHWNSRCQTSVK